MESEIERLRAQARAFALPAPLRRAIAAAMLSRWTTDPDSLVSSDRALRALAQVARSVLEDLIVAGLRDASDRRDDAIIAIRLSPSSDPDVTLIDLPPPGDGFGCKVTLPFAWFTNVWIPNRVEIEGAPTLAIDGDVATVLRWIPGPRPHLRHVRVA